ncbi:MAG: hypothetical protein M0R76_01740 [Proteobacteria bacterium]|nr:hypothetical protein [Pseudomonadota bacterium]
MSIPETQMDRRILDRNIRSGVISEKQLKAYLAALPDKASESEPIVMGDAENGSDSQKDAE